MKKILCFSLLILVVFGLWAVDGVAATDTDTAVFNNPAQVFFYKAKHRLQINTSFNDVFKTDRDSPFFNNPELDLGFVFAAKGIAASLDFDLISIQTGKQEYMMKENYIINVAASYGYKFVSAGFGVKASFTRVRTEIPVRDGHRFVDLVQGGFVESKRRLAGSDAVSVRGGISFDLGEFSAGVLVNDIFSYANEKYEFSWRQIAESMDIGFSWNQERFASRGSLKTFVMSADCEIDSVLSDSACVSAKVTGTLQFTRDFTLSVYAGYSAGFNSFDDGVYLIGAGANLGIVNCYIDADFPLDYISSGEGNILARAGVSVLL